MNFASVKSLTIPEGKVKLITRKSDGAVLWKGGYKNWARYSTEADGKTIYNGGLGYKEGYRIRSGGAESESSIAICTGFIPFVKGDKLYIFPPFTEKNTNNAINFADGTFTNLGQVTDSGGGYGICGAQVAAFKTKVVNGVSVLDLSQNTVSGVENIAYVRITNDIYALPVGAEMIITKNEEIPETDISSTLSMRTLTPEMIRQINEENAE